MDPMGPLRPSGLYSETEGLTSSVRQWLETVFWERLGQHFIIAPGEAGFTFLKLSGSDKVISIRNTRFPIDSPSTHFPIAWWNPVAEGYSTEADSLLPAPGVSTLQRPLVESTSTGKSLGYDVLSLMAWMLSRYEEFFCEALDSHDRVPSRCCHASVHGYLDRPIIDEWMRVISQIIIQVWPNIQLSKTPSGRAITCDVDRPFSPYLDNYRLLFKKVGMDIVKNRSPRLAKNTVLNYLLSKRKIYSRDPYNTFDWMMDVNELNNNEVMFYFMVNHSHPEFDSYYDIDSSRMRSLLRRINNRGHLVGLHPSYKTFENGSLLKSELTKFKSVLEQERIDQDILSVRHHYLRWSHRFSLEVFEESGVALDSSLGFADKAGFRCGTSHDYTMYDLLHDRAARIKQRPLIMMDITFFDTSYMGREYSQETLELMKGYKEACYRGGGLFTLLWHNCHLDSEQDRDFYLSLISG